MRDFLASRYRLVGQIAACVSCCALFGCDKPASLAHHWTDVSQLTGGTMETHFVVVDPKFIRDRRIYEDAGDSLCSKDVCQIGFFADRNDVPNETLTADFFNNGGWENRHEIALFFRNSNSGLTTLQFDCNVISQPDLNSCLEPVKPSPGELKAAQARGSLSGLGRAKFGMTIPKLTAALGGPDKVSVLDPAFDRTIIRTKTAYHGRTYNAFYNVTGSGFSTLLMKWSAIVNNDACAQEAKKIAADVSSDFGKEDNFSYYETGGKTFRYRWLFADGANVELSNLDMKEHDCSLVLHFNAKGAT